VLIEDVIEAVNIHKILFDHDDTHDSWPHVTLMNTTETSGGFVFQGGVIKNEDYSPLQKKLLKLLEGFCVFGYWEYYKKLLCILVEAYKTIMGLAPQFQKNSWKCSI
jgi:hypothetical protein